MYNKVKVDDSFWTLEDGKEVSIALQKVSKSRPAKRLRVGRGPLSARRKDIRESRGAKHFLRVKVSARKSGFRKDGGSSL